VIIYRLLHALLSSVSFSSSPLLLGYTVGYISYVFIDILIFTTTVLFIGDQLLHVLRQRSKVSWCVRQHVLGVLSQLNRDSTYLDLSWNINMFLLYNKSTTNRSSGVVLGETCWQFKTERWIFLIAINFLTR